MNFVRRQPILAISQVFVFTVIAVIAIVLLGIPLESVQGANFKFPYEATIFTDDVEVYSGPGSRFYATGKLKKGSVVAVHRHDPGGWYMIAPPPGSFSLVRADYIKKQGPKQGIVLENNVIARVGSEISDHMEVEQRRLMKGDQIEVLGSDMREVSGQNREMLKIAPPRGEFRWVKGDFIVPVDPNLRKVHDADPFAVPSNGVEIEKQPESSYTPDLSYPIASKDNGPKKVRPVAPSWNTTSGAVSSGYNEKNLEQDRAILDALDRNFRTMIQQDIAQWRLEDLTHDYQKLQKSTSIDPIAKQIDLRIAAMERYRKIKAEYDDLIRLTSATDRRDAQLLSMQHTTEAAYTNPFDEMGQQTAFPAGSLSGYPQQALRPETSTDQFLPYLGPEPQFSEQDGNENRPMQVYPGAAHQTGPGTSLPVPPQSGWGPQSQSFPPQQQALGPHMMPPARFSGAGILKKVGSWNGQTPPYVLVDNNNQLLAYLQPVHGLQLEGLLGQSVGVTGSRHNVPALQADLIQVVNAAPVQLSR